MIDRILVPLDGSLVAEQILPQLRRLLFRHDSEVILVRAAVPPALEHGMMLADEVLASARSYLMEMQDRLQAQGVRARGVTRLGNPISVILDVAESEKATMIAMASHGETGLRRLLAGSVAESIVKESPVPVFLLRPFWSHDLLPSRADQSDRRPIRNILLPVDDPGDAEALLPSLIELARLFESRVVLLHVQEGKPPNAADPEALLSGLVSTLKGRGVETLSLAGRGDPAREILDTARAHEIDLIAMATHGKSSLLRFLSGSVTRQVLHESTCPMLVVRAGKPGDVGQEAERVRAGTS